MLFRCNAYSEFFKFSQWRDFKLRSSVVYQRLRGTFCLLFQSWKLKQHVPPKHYVAYSILIQDVTTQKAILWNNVFNDLPAPLTRYWIVRLCTYLTYIYSPLLCQLARGEWASVVREHKHILEGVCIKLVAFSFRKASWILPLRFFFWGGGELETMSLSWLQYPGCQNWMTTLLQAMRLVFHCLP
jgi:hypothetical protein